MQKSITKTRKIERNEEIFKMRELGFKYKDIANKYKISVGRARQIYLRQQRDAMKGRRYDNRV